MALKVFWAIDPFDEGKEIRGKALKALDWFAAKGSSRTAVHVYSPPEIAFPAVEVYPVAAGWPEPSRKEVAKKLAGLKVKGVKTEMIDTDSPSLTASARALAGFVADRRGDLIVAPTHARTGVQRIVLGSFVETLIHFAKTDLLLFRPSAVLAARGPKHIVYAHDFSRRGDIGLKRALRYAGEFGARLTVLHVPHLIFGLRSMAQESETQAYRDKVWARGRRIDRLLTASGVEGCVEIATEWAPLVTMILKSAAKLKADVVAVTAQSGRFAALLGGSVTRGIVRNAGVPTLVLKI